MSNDAKTIPAKFTPQELERLKREGARARLLTEIHNALWRVRYGAEQAGKDNCTDFEFQIGTTRAELDRARQLWEELQAYPEEAWP